MIIVALAVNYHDSCMALMKDGRLIEVVELERIFRIKRIRNSKLDYELLNLLERNDLALRDINFIATSLNGGLPEGIEWNFKSKYSMPLRHNGMLHSEGEAVIRTMRIPAFAIHHHAAHASTAYYGSNFNSSIALSIDGGGDYDCFTTFRCEAGKISFYDSKSVNLGMLYSLIGSRFFGMESGAAAGKLMAYAALHEPNPVIIDKFLEMFDRIEKLDIRRRSNLIEILEKSTGLYGTCFKSYKDNSKIFVASLQKAFEKYLVLYLKQIRLTEKISNLSLSGGCALNCVANTVIKEKAGFENLYIPPCCHDGGIAIGLLFYTYYTILNQSRLQNQNFTYLGQEYQNPDSINSLKKVKTTILGDDLFSAAAKLLKDGKIIGWFQGRSEIGPRALGNRSIIDRPDELKIKDKLNYLIKEREWYRPFAPVVISEKASSYFSGPMNSYMSFASKVIDDRLSGVTHVDGTARVQKLLQSDNKKLFKLLSIFNEMEGIPVLLNTSFNRNNEPIVETPDDAISVLLNRPLDAVFINDMLIERNF